MFCHFCVCFFFAVCLSHVVSHEQRAGRGPIPLPPCRCPCPFFLPCFNHFDLCCLCNSFGLLKSTQHLRRIRCSSAVLRWRLPAKWKALKNANQFAPFPQTLLKVQHATSVNFADVSYFCGGGVGVGVGGFLPLTLPLLYDDNKSRKATTTTTTRRRRRRTETQLGQLSVYIIDRPLLHSAPHLCPRKSNSSFCLFA